MENNLFLVEYDVFMESKKISFVKCLENLSSETMDNIFSTIGCFVEDNRHYSYFEQTFKQLVDVSTIEGEDDNFSNKTVIGKELAALDSGFLMSGEMSVSLFTSPITIDESGNASILPTVKRITGFNIDTYNILHNILIDFDIEMMHFAKDEAVLFGYKSFETSADIDSNIFELEFAFASKKEMPEFKEYPQLEIDDYIIYLFDRMVSPICLFVMLDKVLDSTQRYRKRA